MSAFEETASLIVFGGLPASGKSTLATRLARDLDAVHLRIDTIEQAMLRSGLTISGPEGYLIACDLAEDNLKLGHRVIADAVNPIKLTRNYWRDVAKRTCARIAEVEVICSNKEEHRNRAESRVADIPGHQLPTWQQILDRNFEPWEETIVIDTYNQDLEECLLTLKTNLETEASWK